MAIFAVCGLQSCGDDDKDINPDQAYVNALNNMNLNLQNVKWEKKGAYKVAEGQQGLFEVEVWFDAEAKWAMTETDYERDYSNLPQAVINALNTINGGNSAATGGITANWAIDDVEYFQRPDMNFFKIKITEPGQKDVYQYFTVDGNLLKSTTTDEDVTPLTKFPTAPAA